MALETTLQPRQKWWNVLYAAICMVLALWGAYDYFVTIPRKEQAVATYDAAAKRLEELQAKGQAVSAEEKLEYKDLTATVDKGRPTPPAAYDRPVQLWMYMVGCGVLGVPWFLWAWLAAARRSYRLEDDGTLVAPEGRIGRDAIADIDMSRWMSKSIATVKLADGRSIVLDDYKYRNMHLIVGAIASARYPEDWTEDARDLKKIRAEAEAAARAPVPESPAGESPNG
jgi:hypothetical protein